jgi:berberine-like enzyme
MTGVLGEAAVSVAVCDSGPIADGEPRLEALRQFGPPLSDTIRPMPYVDLQSMFDVGAPFGLGAFWKSCYLRELTGDAAETIAKHATRMTSPLSQVLVTHMQGAVSRVDPEATAFGHRDAPHVLEILAKWRMGEDPAPHVEWAERFWDEMRPFSTGGVYVNFLGDEGPEQIRAAYTPGAYDRLVGLKGRYDPENFFSWNQNIPPEPAKATADA